MHITSQNHGYAVDGALLRDEAEVDSPQPGTTANSGGPSAMRLPVLSIQYHSEASPGPQDNVYIFDKFLILCIRSDEGSDAHNARY